MKIGIISDSPTVTTGFGITTNNLAHGLTTAGHEVVCFGLKAPNETFEHPQYPFRIWPVDQKGKWAQLLARFLDEERFDSVLINMDIFNLKEVMSYCQAAAYDGPFIAYLICDGLPVYKEYLEVVTSAHMVVVTTQSSARYLEECGIHVMGVAPPGVDSEVFKPLPHAALLRQQGGLEGKFVVGVFGRNTERKQQARVLIALSQLKEMGREANVVVYFHCQARAYWYLDEIAKELGIQDLVIFADELLDETAGVPYVQKRSNEGPDDVLTQAHSSMRMPGNFSYVERINCCDLIINVAHCGDFEQVIIEAQSCGIPLAATDDRGIMAEALGDGGILLETIDVSFWKAGQRNYFVSTEAIAQAILAVKDDQSLRAILREKGVENARKYTWDRMNKVIIEAVAHLETPC